MSKELGPGPKKKASPPEEEMPFLDKLVLFFL